MSNIGDELKIFNKEYARYYDIFYFDKDYERECDFLETIFKKILNEKPKTILDIGCGTGSHAFILVERGYDITGIDISENMISIARNKSKNLEVDIKFNVADIRNLKLDEKFDACIGMFNMMGYIIKNSDIKQALDNVHKHLKPNGLFVFDVWNGLAVMRILPEIRFKEVDNDDIKLIRFAQPRLRSFDHICEVNYELIILNKNEGTLNRINEKHTVRFYFPQEMKYYLENAGFELVRMCPFMNLNGNVNEDVWNMTIVARALDKK